MKNFLSESAKFSKLKFLQERYNFFDEFFYSKKFCRENFEMKNSSFLVQENCVSQFKLIIVIFVNG